MKYKIIPSDDFEKEFKKLYKRYKSLKSDLEKLLNKLQENPTIGESLGNNTYKIRLLIKSKNKGASAGGRVITYYIDDNKTIFLVFIFDKSDFENISDTKINEIIKSIL
jgi:mRNA-degrading endonuclease RelE of RelBE toxin-antitoxin system